MTLLYSYSTLLLLASAHCAQAAPIPAEMTTHPLAKREDSSVNSGTYVGIAIGVVCALLMLLYVAYMVRRVNKFKKTVATNRSRSRASNETSELTEINLQAPQPSAQPGTSISRLLRSATGRNNNNSTSGNGAGSEDTQRLIAPVNNRNRSNSATSITEVDLNRHPSLASVYRKTVKCLTQRELNSMFPAVPYSEMAYNMKLQNLNSSNIYTTLTNTSANSTAEITQEHDTLGSTLSNTQLFEAYPPVRPKRVHDSDDEDENDDDPYDLGPYEENVCIICQGDLESEDMVRMLSCHHIFHDECVSPWILEKNGTCPLCKRDLTKEVPLRVTADQDEKIEQRLAADEMAAAGSSSSATGADADALGTTTTQTSNSMVPAITVASVV
ncbi:hypothetical protein DV495_002097 [Geotrichum candidum]|uniref:RING-type E3 ubiquitin transferase n=1 Tax=Geotrichum candidum TaxID=1173061 RepID=A0A0J9XK33_GEOCN|nr:hypothetical protein DV454_003096 [Geotrichum candidum]KAI9214588.1 hypothetical protein DS838_000538 [Geotrichum bryndzae]KAF5124471.1 hypothetical protein DV452_000180 [Geotrichum candidum]KAF5131670.1 hypothetical protein DV495_002097 [Geotrichum candidum]KAF7500523.1 hypothetical protein DV113_001410 [Geotrichum candidum]